MKNCRIWRLPLVLIVLSSCTNSKKEVYTLYGQFEPERLYGNVKSLTEVDIKIDMTSWSGLDTPIIHFWKFDRMGNKEEHSAYKLGREFYTNKWIYDSNNQAIKLIEFHKNDTTGVFRFKYDERSNIIEEHYLIPEDSITSSTFRTFDQNNKVIKVETKIPMSVDSHYTQIEKYQYQNDDYSRYTTYDDDTIVQSKLLVRVNADKKPIQYIEMDKNEDTISITNMSYDNYGNVLESVTRDLIPKETKTINSKYTFDEHKNWVKQEVYQDGKLTNILVRSIIYW